MSFPALFGYFTFISSLCRPKCSTLVGSVVLGFSVQTHSVMPGLYFLRFTGMSNSSSSFPDEILFLCLRFILPQCQSTTWAFDRDTFGKASLFWSPSGCRHLFLSETDIYLTSV